MSESQRIVGLTKKGKEFFKMTSTSTETIRSICIEDTRIWTGCEFIHNIYDNGKDSGFFAAQDAINDLYVGNITRDTDFDAVLACQDCCIRVLHGSTQYCEVRIPCCCSVLIQEYLIISCMMYIHLVIIRCFLLVYGC